MWLKPSNNGMYDLNFELASSQLTRQLLGENKIMWKAKFVKAKFVECFALTPLASLPPNATDDEIATRNHFKDLRLKGAKPF